MLPAQIRKVMVATHRPGIPPHLATKFQPVSPGQSWVLIPDQQWDTNTYMAVKRAPILAKISDQWFSVVLHQGVIKDLPAGYEVLKFGCEGKDFYIIIAGTVKVSDGDGVKAILSTGEFFGEISAQYGSPCNATIETLSPVRLLAIRKEIFRELVAKTGKLQWLNTIHNMRPVLMKIHQLREMSTAALHQLFAVAKMEQYEAGEIIIAEGDEADRMFGIIHGKVEVWHQNGHGPELLATLTESDLFGEVALWKKGRRTATVKAVTDLQVFSIAKKDFDRVCEEIPVFGLMIGKLVEERSL
jgi:CRP-like cAMP-binding protein